MFYQQKNNYDSLREKAQQLLRSEDSEQQPEILTDIEKAIEELQIHQIELQMQNEALKRTQDELECAKKSYQELYDFAPIAYITVSQLGNLLSANNATARLLGKKRDNLLLTPFSHYIHPDDRYRFFQYLDTVFSHQHSFDEVFTDEFRLLKGKEELRYLSVQSSLYFDKAQKVYLCRMALSDITALQESQNQNALMLSLVEDAHEAIIGLDSSMSVTVCNPAAEDLFAYQPGCLLGVPLQELFPPASYPLIYESAEQLSYDDNICQSEMAFIAPDGQARHLMFCLTSIPGKNKQNVGYSLIINDLTREKENREALLKWGNIFKYADWGVAIVNPENLCLEMLNPAFAKMHGYTVADLVGTPLYELCQCESSELTAHLSVAHEKGRYSSEHQHFHKDGHVLPVLVDIIIVRNKVANQNYTVINLQDLSERKDYEKALMLAQNDAQKSERLKMAFLANISHEIRTPMNGILGFAELLRKNNLPKEKRTRFLDVILESGRHLLSVLNNILDVSKIESGEVKINPSVYPLNLMLVEMYTYFSSSQKFLSKKELTLYVKRGLSDEACRIVSDQAKLRQILFQLIDNAIKFTHKGEVEFGYRLIEDAQTLEFFVRDTGIGLTTDEQSFVFERFRQVDQTHTRKYGGTGLGLSIARAYCEALGGTLWVESQKKQGAVFRFTIPYEPSKQKNKYTENKQQNTKPMEERDWKTKTILVVEDDFISAQFFDEILESTGVKLLHVNNGKDAIEKCRQDETIDLVLMDIQLPRMTGYDATRAIKELKPNLPIIAQTANALIDDERRSVDAGCDAYITKPIIAKRLFKLLDQYL